MLLSCCHVFHRDCLRSWERHSRSRCCPVCRKEGYQTRAHEAGNDLFLHECVTAIQAAARARSARQKHGAALRARVHAVLPGRRRDFCVARLGTYGDCVERRALAGSSEIDALFQECGAGVTALRAALGHGQQAATDWEEVKARCARRGLSDCPICLVPLGHVGDGGVAEEHCGRMVLLSCSHAFHDRCIAAFEAFSLSSARRWARRWLRCW